MVNIQVHGVKNIKWARDEKGNAYPRDMPQVLVLDTTTGEQKITLFMVRDAVKAEPMKS